MMKLHHARFGDLHVRYKRDGTTQTEREEPQKEQERHYFRNKHSLFSKLSTDSGCLDKQLN